MNRILVATLLSLILIALTGIVAFGSPHLLGPQSDLIIFGCSCMYVVAFISAVVRSERDRRTNQELTLNLENANIKLTQLDKLKSEFLSFASHQIKAPMTVVKGYAQLISDGNYGPVSDQVRDIVDKIKASSDRMIGLVNTFLDLRRIDEGRVQYHMEPVDLGGLLAAIVDEMHQLADKKHLRLVLLPQTQPWKVNGDAQYLRQVLQNLIDNAIKYTDSGSVSVSIQPDADKSVTVSITDTGRGISHELAPKLFEQFSRDASISKEIAGTGLGLYIARSIIEAHKGKIWAVSDGPGKGSSFKIRLPLL